jgi:hypothetical protein
MAGLMLLGTTVLADPNTSAAVQSCALREAEMMALLELRDAENAAQDLMARAGTDMHQARLACYAGRNDDANAVYDGISDQLGASRMAREVRR